MSYTAFEACLDPDRRSCDAADLATLLALAAHVNQEEVERGWGWRAWPSQEQLAHELGLSDRQVRRRLASLKAAGDIRENGEHRGRGIKVYEITLRPRSDVSGVAREDRTEPSTLDDIDRGPESQTKDCGQDRPAARTDLTATPDRSDHDPGPYCPTEPEGNREEEPEEEPEARAGARATGVSLNPQVQANSSRDVATADPLSPPCWPIMPAIARQAEQRREAEADLASLEAQLPTSKHPEQTERAIEDLRARLATPTATETAA